MVVFGESEERPDGSKRPWYVYGGIADMDAKRFFDVVTCSGEKGPVPGGNKAIVTYSAIA